MLREYEAGKDPVSTMNVLKALRWGIQAWHLDVKDQTIQNCFIKALMEKEINTQSDDGAIQMVSQGLQQLQSSSRIRDLMDVNTFLNPVDEKVEDSIEKIDEDILARYGPEIDAESDEEYEELPRISFNEALDALKNLRLHEEQQDDGDQGLIQALDRHERALAFRKSSRMTQGDIRSFFGG